MGGTKNKEEKKKKAHVYSYVLASLFWLSLLDKLFDARKPYTTYIFTFLVATPFIIFTGPVLSLLGLLGKTHMLIGKTYMHDNASLPYMTAKLGILIKVAEVLSHD